MTALLNGLISMRTGQRKGALSTDGVDFYACIEIKEIAQSASSQPYLGSLAPASECPFNLRNTPFLFICVRSANGCVRRASRRILYPLARLFAITRLDNNLSLMDGRVRFNMSTSVHPSPNAGFRG